MTEFASYEPGTPSWVDLMSPDVDASKAFYSSLFGWDGTDELDDDGNRIYVTFRKDGKQVAGLGGQTPGMEGMPAIWNSYVAVDDVDLTSKKVEAAGGTVMMPGMDVMDAGRMAVYSDPTGAAISVWQAKQHIGAELCNVDGTWSWNELMTRDLDAAKAFYAEVFDWNLQDMAMPTGPYTVVVAEDGRSIAGMMTMPDDVPSEVPNYWGVYFSVDAIDETIDRATSLGATVVFGPEDMEGVGRLATLHDPQNGAFSLMQPAQTD